MEAKRGKKKKSEKKPQRNSADISMCGYRMCPTMCKTSNQLVLGLDNQIHPVMCVLEQGFVPTGSGSRMVFWQHKRYQEQTVRWHSIGTVQVASQRACLARLLDLTNQKRTTGTGWHGRADIFT